MKRILSIMLFFMYVQVFAQQNGWGNWATMYTDSDMKVEVQFYISNAMCQGGKPFKFRTKVTGKMRSYPYYVNWKFDYKDCNGNSYFQQQGVEIGNATGGNVDELMAESMDNRFTGLELEQPFYDVSAGYAEIRNTRMNAKPFTAAEIQEKKQWETALEQIETAQRQQAAAKIEIETAQNRQEATEKQQKAANIQQLNKYISQYPNGKFTQEAIALLVKMGVTTSVPSSNVIPNKKTIRIGGWNGEYINLNEGKR